MAGYAVTSYILQVKDRHNGNIMFDNDGHMVHIDFGFLFDTSPARDMKFEKPGFKLTLEVISYSFAHSFIDSHDKASTTDTKNNT